MEGMSKFWIFQNGKKNVVYDMKFVRLGSQGGFAEGSSHMKCDAVSLGEQFAMFCRQYDTLKLQEQNSI